MEKPKFKVGDKVKFATDLDSEAGVVVSMSFDSDKGWCYRFAVKEVDFEKKEVYEGIKTCLEDELELVEKAKNKDED